MAYGIEVSDSLDKSSFTRIINYVARLAYVAYCVEPAYSRMAGLHAIAYRDIYRADRLSDGAGQYIEREFAKQRNIVGDQCTQSAAYQYENRTSVAMCTLDSLSSDFPLVSISILVCYVRGLIRHH